MTDLFNNISYLNNYSLFILTVSIIVIVNTDQISFESIIKNGDVYYQFYQFLLYSSILSTIFISPCAIWIIRELYNYPNSNINLCVVFLLIFIIFICLSQFYMVCNIWQVNKEHSIFFYQEFWYESLVNLTNYNRTKYIVDSNILIDNTWAYYLADVFVRIYSSLVIGVLISLPFTCRTG